MELRDAVQAILKDMPDERVQEVLDFAQFIMSREREEWRTAGRQQFARAYGDDEPDYSERDIRERG